MKRNRKPEQSGMVLVFLALTIVAILTFWGVVITIGFLVTNKFRVQNAVNLTALTALNSLISQPSTNSLQSRAVTATQAAQSFLSNQQFLGSNPTSPALSIGMITPQDGGVIEYGRWFLPNAAGSPCQPGTACFGPEANLGAIPAPLINAVRVRAKNLSPLSSPFSKGLKSPQFLESSAIAAIVPRCTVMVLDASSSSTIQSHDDYIAEWLPAGNPTSCDPTIGMNSPPQFYLCPRQTSFFTYPAGLWNASTANIARTGYCDSAPISNDPNTWDPTTLVRQVICNLKYEGSSTLTDRSTYVGTTRTHFANDYIPYRTRWGQVWVDRVTIPQPLTNFLNAFNAGITMLQNQSSGADLAALLVFQGGIVDPVLDTNTGGLFAANNLGFLQQLTNAANFPNVSPNYIERGWFQSFLPTDQDYSGSNITGALTQAINLIAQQCPATAKKSIILATDGIGNCRNNFQCDNNRQDTNPAPEYQDYYRFSENILLRDGDGVSNNGLQPSLLEQLINNRISLTVLAAGQHVQPHLIDRNVDGAWLSYLDAQARGYTGAITSGSLTVVGLNPTQYPQLLIDARPKYPNSVFNSGGECDGYTDSNKCAYDIIGKSGVAFRRGLAVLGHMSLVTGGIYCPLQALPNASNPAIDLDNYYWDHDSNSETPEILREFILNTTTPLRQEGRIQPFPYERLSPAQQAARCVQQTYGLSAFSLQEEEQ